MMGLDIQGEKTGHHLGGSYSRLHNTVRYLSLVYCGLPNSVGNNKNDGSELDSFVFYMYPSIHNIELDVSKMQCLFSTIQMSGYLFPQINLHSDCGGKYTKRGKLLNGEWTSGNSIKLLQELDTLCNDDDINNLYDKNERFKLAIDHTKKFRDLVKDEIENGNGVILFT